MPQEKVENIEVGAHGAGKRLDAFLSSYYKDFSRSHITNLIKTRKVAVNGLTVTKAGYTVKNNDSVSVVFSAPLPLLNLGPEDIDIDIVYQDGDIAVVNKKQGLVTHPADGSKSGTLVNALLFHLKDLSGINGVERPGIVHRLDKDTSGLLVIAKNDAAHLSLQKQIAQKSARRTYVALVGGNIKEDSGTISAPIARHKKDRKKMAVDANGREAVTHFRVLERFGQYTLVEYELETGRTHQIRVHSKHIGHIIAGDTVYGDSGKLWKNGQLLHAKTLILEHPRTGEKMTFNADLPQYFNDIIIKLRLK